MKTDFFTRSFDVRHADYDALVNKVMSADCSFAGIVHGQKSTDFLKTLVERRFATPISTGKLHRGRMFHVHYKPLWAAIAEPDNRFRKPTEGDA